MSQEEQQTEQQVNDEFEAGFNAVRGSDEQSPEPEKQTPVEQQPAVAEQPEAQQAEAEPEEEKPVLAGLTESQIKTLLERASRVDEIEKQLRNAHGKIGELNGTLKELKTAKQPTPSAPAETSDESFSEFERDFPEVAKLARKTVDDHLKAQQPAQQVQPADYQKDIQLALMDTLHDGWREAVQSQDFSLWLATQAEDVQQTYHTTESAKVLGSVINGFKDWQKSSQNRSAKSKQRLEAAITPDGNPPRITQAPSADDDFAAGFYSVRQRN